jgi:hypothetical protein
MVNASNGYSISRVEFKGYILFHKTLWDLNIGLQSYNYDVVLPQLCVTYSPGFFFVIRRQLETTLLVVLL